MRFRLRILVVVSIGITEPSTERDIASFVIQLSVQLQGCIRRHTLVVAQRTAVDSIYTDTSQRVIVRIENLLQIQPVIGVAHQTVRVGIERTALRIGEIVRFAVREVGTENDIRHRVRLPLHTEIGIEILGFVTLLAVRVGVRVAVRQKVLGRANACNVPILIVVACTTTQFQFIGLGSEVYTQHFRCSKSVVPAPARRTATARKALVVHVIGRTHYRHLGFVHEAVQHKAAHIAVFRPSGHVGITEPTLVHAFLYGQVEHRLLLTVVNTGDTCQIGLLVVGFQLLYHIYRQVLQTGLYVSTEELLAVDHNLRQVLTVDFHITLVVNLRTGQLLHQLLEHGSLGGTIGR